MLDQWIPTLIETLNYLAKKKKINKCAESSIIFIAVNLVPTVNSLTKNAYMANGMLCLHTHGKKKKYIYIYIIKYLTFKRPYKHFNNNRKRHDRPKTNMEKLILKK